MKIIIRIIALVLIVMWLYGIFAYLANKKVDLSNIQDNCTMNSQVNNCIVISTEK